MTARRVLALVGPRCSGKTSLARALADRLDVPAFDLDALLLDEEGPPADSAGALLAAVGEPAFREREWSALRRFLERDEPAVLATGGGAVLREEARERLGARALVVRLEAPAAVLAARIARDRTERPSLTGGDPAREVEAVLRAREPHYRAVADLTLDATRRTAALADELARRVRKLPGRGFVLDPGDGS